jgi:glycerol kinase
MEHILAIDQGTTGTKSLIVDENLKLISEASVPFPQRFPKPGWVEHDLNEIWNSVLASIEQALEQAGNVKISAIGITNQRETLCFWDRETGEPIARAIVWQDRRTADLCKQLAEKGAEPFFQENTGLILDPYFSGTKANWALKNWPEVQTAYKNGRLAIGTIDSYLVARLSGGGTHVTEPSNASRTLCFHLQRHQWDSELCQMLGVPPEIWPAVYPSTGRFGTTRRIKGLSDGTPITGVLGDQQAALLGQACIEEGQAKCTYGTGSFVLFNTGKRVVKSQKRMLSTVAWALSDTDYTYALEGSAFIAGAAVQWLRDGLKIIKKSSDIEELAKSIPSSDGVTFVPALTGLGAPYWNPDATGLFTGLTRGTTSGHLARAVLEGIAFQNAEILIAMKKDAGKPIASLNVDGGAAANNLLMQFQSDILGIELRRPQVLETTSLGAVFASGLGAGIWSDLSDIQKTWKEDRTFRPQIDEKEREQNLKRWNTAVARTLLNT